MALLKHSEQQFRQRAKKVVSDSLGVVDFAQQASAVLCGNADYRMIVINAAHPKGFWG